jgi:hypothetical protein
LNAKLRRTPRQLAIERAETLGCMILDSGDSMRLDAPCGFVMLGELHSIDWCVDGPGDRAEAWREFADALDDGLDLCPYRHCDACIGNEAMTFDEIRKLYGGERIA